MSTPENDFEISRRKKWHDRFMAQKGYDPAMEAVDALDELVAAWIAVHQVMPTPDVIAGLIRDLVAGPRCSK